MGLPHRLREMLRSDLVPTAEIPAQHGNCYAWISIRRLPEDSPIRLKHPAKRYLVKRVEIQKDVVERYLQDDADVTPNDCAGYEKYLAEDEEELHAIIAEWVTNLEDFVEGWKTANPLR